MVVGARRGLMSQGLYRHVQRRFRRLPPRPIAFGFAFDILFLWFLANYHSLELFRNRALASLLVGEQGKGFGLIGEGLLGRVWP